MKALFIVRPDWNFVSGGDVIQVQETSSILNDQFLVETDIVSTLWNIDLAKYDLVHFFHLPAINVDDFNAVKRYGIPIVVSPIFWDTTELWFEDAVVQKPVWRGMDSILGRKASRKLYLNWQASKLRRSSSWKTNRRILQQSDLLLPNSKTEMKHLTDYFKLCGCETLDKAKVIHNGVNKEFFRDLESLREKGHAFEAKHGVNQFVLEVARIEKAKGQASLIKSLMETDHLLVIIGNPSPYESDYVKSVQNLSRQRGNTVVISGLPQEELIGAYVSAKVHVLPSWRETPGLVSLEAAAAGCKIVSTELGSAKDYFGAFATYCDPRDPNSIRSAIEQSAAKQTAPDALRNLILTKFTWEVAARETYSAYQGLL